MPSLQILHQKNSFLWEEYLEEFIVKCKKNPHCDGVALREVIDEKALNWCYECDISDPKGQPSF